MAVKDKIMEIVQNLPEDDAARVLAFVENLREWDEWDRQIEDDAKAGRLGAFDALADEALELYAKGLTKPL